MKAIVIRQPGAFDVLQLEETAIPTPNAGEVLINVAVAGINYADMMLLRGGTPGPHAAQYPMIPGFEVAGIIEAVGAGVTEFTPGMRVAAVLEHGGYAEYAVAPVEKTFLVPDSIDFADATALLVQGLTAYGLIHDAAKLQAGESILVEAAEGGVGSLAVQLAKLAGATVIGAASGSKLELVRALGADVALDYTQPGWGQQVYAATHGRGVDVVLECVGGQVALEAFHSLAPLGRDVIFGGASGQMLPLSELLMPMSFKGISVSGFGGPWLRPGRAQVAHKALTEYVASGQLRVQRGPEFPLDQAGAALGAIASRQTTGKVVLRVRD